MNRTRTVKRIISCMITLALTAFFLHKISSVFVPKDTIDCKCQNELFYSLPNNSVEVIIYGSSHAYRGINPRELYEKYGIGSFNSAWNWQKIDTTRMFIEDSFDYQKPRVILIEAFNAGEVKENADPGSEIFTSKYIRNDRSRREYLRNAFGTNFKSYVGYYFPVLILHDNWSSLTKEDFGELEISDSFRSRMGFIYTDGVTRLEIPDYKTFQQYALIDDAKYQLDKIVSLCNKNGVKIVFFTNPYSGEYNYHDAMTKYAEENGCAYLDLFERYDEVGFDGEADFSDSGHLNMYGANKTADYLGAFLKENYELTDFRQIKDNLWQRSFYGESYE